MITQKDLPKNTVQILDSGGKVLNSEDAPAHRIYVKERPGDQAVRKLQRELGKRFADPDRLSSEDRRRAHHGVIAMYPKNSDLPVVSFRGVTYDSIKWDIEFDFRKFSSAYIAEVFTGLAEQLHDHRLKKRSIVL